LAAREEQSAFDMGPENGWSGVRCQAVAAPASTVIKCLPFPVTQPFTISCHLPSESNGSG
jgi:hypothetical protein